ncbi:MAG TPA: hypothetical protein VGF69_16490 [Thermoanaerobaculia bacterium]|jgi:hypothetical protein
MDLPQSLLSANITAGDRHSFAVSFYAPSVPLPDSECFRLALHYYARVVYELSRSERSVRGLPEWIERISARTLTAASNLFSMAGVRGSLERSIARPAAEASVGLRTLGLRDRQVTGDLSALRGMTLALSVLAMCQAVLPHLSDPFMNAMPTALANMNASYELTHHYADPVSQSEVPLVAFRAASFRD